MYDAVVLAGGTGRRMGGVDKPGLEVGGVTMLDRVLLAARDANTTIVVGPERPTARQVLWTREDPVGGGPVAALYAGLAHVTADRVVLLAADLPFLDRDTVRRLGEVGDVVLVDDRQPQWLCSGWGTAALREALEAIAVDGARLKDVLGPLQPARVTRRGADGAAAPWMDVDTPADLVRAQELA